MGMLNFCRQKSRQGRDKWTQAYRRQRLLRYSDGSPTSDQEVVRRASAEVQSGGARFGGTAMWALVAALAFVSALAARLLGRTGRTKR